MITQGCVIIAFLSTTPHHHKMSTHSRHIITDTTQLQFIHDCIKEAIKHNTELANLVDDVSGINFGELITDMIDDTIKDGPEITQGWTL